MQLKAIDINKYNTEINQDNVVFSNDWTIVKQVDTCADNMCRITDNEEPRGDYSSLGFQIDEEIVKQ